MMTAPSTQTQWGMARFGGHFADELLAVFLQKTQDLPRSTEVERLIIQRVGQDLFRAGLLEFWEGRCALTGLAIPDLLRASHIKPWADCDHDAERLDIGNGFLFAPQIDAAFDRGFVTFADDGAIVLSPPCPTPPSASWACTSTCASPR